MRIAVIGAGAVGTVVAAELAGRGHDVLLGSRRPHPDEKIRVDVASTTLVEAVPVLTIAVELVGPGHARWTYGTDLAVPEGPLGEDFARLFDGARIRVVQRPDFDAAAWQKVLINSVANPITALTGRRMEVFRDGEIDILAHTLLEEAVSAARASGVDLTDAQVEEARRIICGLSPDTGTSMLYDRLAGRPTEHALILGAVARAADAHGVPAPATHALLALLHALP